jgi:hypothetical protein
MGSVMAEPQLTPEQEVEAQRIAQIVQDKFRAEALQMARLLASKTDGDIFGQTEFDIRDRVHQLGCVMYEAALEERKKRGTKDAALSVRTARNRPAS